MEVRPLPLGCYFRPKPHDCIKYLTCKVDGKKELSCEGLIFERNPYNPKELPDIFLAAERSENLYLFTKLQRKGRPGSVHINRTVGNGNGKGKSSWHGDQTKEVWDADNISVIGTARTFTYWEKGSIDNRRFLMTEYQLLPTHGNYDPLKDHVLCHIRCPEGKKSNKSYNRNLGSKQVRSLTSDSPVQVQNGPQMSSPNSNLMLEFPSSSSIPVDGSYSLQTLASPEVEHNEPDSHLALDWNDWANGLELEGITGDEGQQDDNEGVLELCPAAPVSETFVVSPARAAFESQAIHGPVTPDGDSDGFNTVTTMDFESRLDDDFDWNSLSEFFGQEEQIGCYNPSLFQNVASFTS